MGVCILERKCPVDALSANSDSTSKHDGNVGRRWWSTETAIGTEISWTMKKAHCINL
jgi:hypothetical protein